MELLLQLRNQVYIHIASLEFHAAKWPHQKDIYKLNRPENSRYLYLWKGGWEIYQSTVLILY